MLSTKRLYFLRFLLPILLLADLGYTYIQQLEVSIKGDLVFITAPISYYQNVLEDPFGWEAVSQQKEVAGVNRYMIHASLKTYFDHVPLWFHSFLDPVASVYTASALFSTLLQLCFYLVLASYIMGGFLWEKWRFWLAVLGIAPLFQIFGYHSTMEVFNQSIVYTFFYAFPLLILLIFFLPYYISFAHPHRKASVTLSIPKLVIWSGMAVWLAFSGPLVGPLAILICGGLLGYAVVLVPKQQQMGKKSLGLLIFFLLISLYSYYVGTFNAENPTDGPDIWERFALLPQGLFRILTLKLGWPLLLLTWGISMLLFRKNELHKVYPQFVRTWQVLSLLIVAYICLLPLGGYRPYRPFIIRGDTFIPVTLICFIGVGTWVKAVLTSFSWPRLGINQRLYLALLGIVMLVFTFADKLPTRTHCEKDTLYVLLKDPETPFPPDCAVLSWDPVVWDKEEALIKTMLKRWEIIPAE